MYEYDATFYEYISRGAISSAREILPLVQKAATVNSVVDFGCGQGAWLSVWKELGVADVTGVDGMYVDENALLIDADEFDARNLAEPIDLGRRFGLVQSLEVAEHLPASAAAGFVDTLVCHGHLVLFSAAAPGQGGENHINEQPYKYWRNLFLAHGYVCCDLIRPTVRNNNSVEPWYRYNTFLYVDWSYLLPPPAVLVTCRLDDDAPIPDISPLCYKVRKAILRSLSPRVLTWFAIVKKWVIVGSRR